MIIITCGKHGPLTIEQVNKLGKKKNGEQDYACKACRKEIARKHYEDNKERVKAKHAKYRVENRQQWLASKKKYFEKNREKCYAIWREKRKRPEFLERENLRNKKRKQNDREVLNETYIRNLLAKGCWDITKPIPESIINIKRELVNLSRLIRECKKSAKLINIEDKHNEKHR